jgi:mono/diheme cytochrome c family protein
MILSKLCIPSAILAFATIAGAQTSDLAASLGISFPSASPSTLLLTRDGKQYVIDVAAKTVREVAPGPAQQSTAPPPTGNHSAAMLFAKNCATCHGPQGRGIPSAGTPDFKNPAVQRSLTDQGIRDTIHNGKAGGRMPAWSGKLTDPQIAGLASYIRSFSAGTVAGQAGSTSNEQPQKPTIYEPGDDVLVSLPTGRPAERHGVYVNFAHRFAYDPAFTGSGRGGALFGLDGFAIPSFGFNYGVTDKLAVSIYRSPSIIGRPIQLMAGYSLLDEHKGDPLNMMVRVSVEGQDHFRKNFTENIEGIFSRSITSRAQFYLVPTMSFNDRPLAQGGFGSQQIPELPGINAFSLGAGLAIDVRPTVALLAEVIPTLVNGRALGIHRPVYSFGIQKKIWRHAFTLGLTTGPGTTVSQRAGTRAQFLGDPSADTPGGLFIGFDLTRQIH